MLVNLETVAGFVRSRVRRMAAIMLAGSLVLSVGAAIRLAGPPASVPLPDGGLQALLPGQDQPVAVAGNLEAVGMELMTTYLLPFELVSIVLLVAVIGAIVLCRREA